jgi:hypothetical protein
VKRTDTLLLEKQREELLAALKVMTITFLTGEHYRTCNPYLRPEVKQAMVAIGKAEGKSTFGYDWQDVLSKEMNGYLERQS